MNAKCPCQVCNNHLEFDAKDAGQSVTCPHCGMDTTLFVPPNGGMEAVAEVQDPHLIYRLGNVAVSDTYLKVEHSTYPVAAISSFRLVEIAAVCPAAATWSYIGAAVSFLIAVIMFASEADYTDPQARAVKWIAAAMIIGAIVLSFVGVTVQAKSKPTYGLSITTSAREQLAVTSPDARTVRDIASALQKAVEIRG